MEEQRRLHTLSRRMLVRAEGLALARDSSALLHAEHDGMVLRVLPP